MRPTARSTQHNNATVRQSAVPSKTISTRYEPPPSDDLETDVKQDSEDGETSSETVEADTKEEHYKEVMRRVMMRDRRAKRAKERTRAMHQGAKDRERDPLERPEVVLEDEEDEDEDDRVDLLGDEEQHTDAVAYSDDEGEEDGLEEGAEGEEGHEEEGSEDEYDEKKSAMDPLELEEMQHLQNTVRGIKNRFRLVGKVGEGTFSTVYKAEDIYYDRYDNSWDFEATARKKQGLEPRKRHYVAIKKIYVTSSPQRIQNELELLHDLNGSSRVLPLITAFRHQDQVVAILPFFSHTDFRDYFRIMEMGDIQQYFRQLFRALEHVHKHKIIHRDIKPTNFLYDAHKGYGVLVDFGLAEKEGTDWSYCVCQDQKKELKMPKPTLSAGYVKNDCRPSKRANRAGTRGFRAPEVLLKCTSQTCKIDIWSAGVILLTMLTKRFPFFNSPDDIEALIEIATIFGKQNMRWCATLHGCVFETNIPTIQDRPLHLDRLVISATDRGPPKGSTGTLDPDEKLAVKFMQQCFEIDPLNRMSAADALRHEFLVEEEGSDVDSLAEY